MNNLTRSTTLLFFLLAFATNAQQIDTRTQNQVKAKFAMANEYYNEGNYSDALEKIIESEELLNGVKLPSLIDLKVKTLIAKKEFQQAKDVLFILEGLELNNEIIQNMGKYSMQIDNGIEAEILEKRTRLIENIQFRSMYYYYSKTSIDPLKTVIIQKNNKNEFVRINEVSSDLYDTYIVNQYGLVTDKVFQADAPFSKDGFAVLQEFKNQEMKQWYVNSEGKEFFSYEIASNFQDGFAVVYKNDVRVVINTSGKIILREESWYSPVDDRKLELFGEPNEGMIRIGYRGNDYPNLGYYNLVTGEVIERKFSDAGRFSEGLAWVTYNGKDYAINKKGELVIGPFDHVEHREPFKLGLSVIRKSSNPYVFGVMNNKGEMIIPFESYNNHFYAVKVNSEGFVVVNKSPLNQEPKFGLFDANGKELFPCVYKGIYTSDTEGGIVTYTNEGIATLYNRDLQVISNLEYSWIWPTYTEDRRPAKFGSYYGFIDKFGIKKIEYEFDEVKLFKDGLAPVKKNGRWGVINKNGEEVIPFLYDAISYFFDGIGVAELNGQKFLIDSNGNKVY